MTNKLNNNKYKIEAKDKPKITVTIQNGCYTVELLSSYVKCILEKNKLDKEVIIIISNRTLKKITIKIKTDYALEISSPETRRCYLSFKNKLGRD